MLGLLVVLTITLPWCGALAVRLAGDARPRAQHTLAVAAAAASALTALGLVYYNTPAPALLLPGDPTFGPHPFYADGLGAPLAAIATTLGSLTVLFSVGYRSGARELGRYYALILLFIGGMVGLVLAGSLVTLTFFWELIALCSYALIAFESDDPAAAPGARRALVLTQLGSVGLLLGAFAVHGALGTYDLRAVLAQASALPMSVRALFAYGLLAAAAAKSAQFPFHSWLPGAMAAPSPVSALIHAATLVNAGVYLLIRIYPLGLSVPGWTTTVMTVGVLSAALGALQAARADDLKRALAYSTISQLGYLFFAVGAGGLFAAEFHLLNHAVFKALLFLAAGAFIHAYGTRDLTQLAGAARGLWPVGIAFTAGALALAGVPPFNGSWSKELILESGADAAPLGALALLCVAGLTAFYVTRLTVTLWAKPGAPATHLAPSMVAALVPLALGTLLTTALIGPLYTALAATLPHLGLHSNDISATLMASFFSQETMLTRIILLAGAGAWFALARTAPQPPLRQLIAKLSTFTALILNTVDRTWAGITGHTANASHALAHTQTGIATWNLLAAACGLLALLATFAFSAWRAGLLP